MKNSIIFKDKIVIIFFTIIFLNQGILNGRSKILPVKYIFNNNVLKNNEFLLNRNLKNISNKNKEIIRKDIFRKNILMQILQKYNLNKSNFLNKSRSFWYILFPNIIKHGDKVASSFELLAEFAGMKFI